MIGGNPVYQAYVEILKRELICAMGCTEPIALAYSRFKANVIQIRMTERELELN